MSPRLAPQVIGMGLLESVPESSIVDLADPDDADGDGISGRVNRVWNPRTQQTELGRFGWKANVPSVEAQVAGAFHGDIGITSALHPDQDCTATQTDCAAAINGGEPELTDERLAAVTFYSRTLAVPSMRDTDSDDVEDGAAAFSDLGCASCHTPTLTTGDAASVDVATLADQTIHPYTDLLLHDMGEPLGDGRPDFEASGTEWRTPPLWGLGLIEEINGRRFLLHDGRARTLEEAILWHGGRGRAGARGVPNRRRRRRAGGCSPSWRRCETWRSRRRPQRRSWRCRRAVAVGRRGARWSSRSCRPRCRLGSRRSPPQRPTSARRSPHGASRVRRLPALRSPPPWRSGTPSSRSGSGR